MAFEDLVGDLVEEDEIQIDHVLSDRHEAFCREYVTNGNFGAKAYITCGYSAATAGPASSRLLSNVTIKKRIAELTAPRLTASALTLENTLAQIAAISQFDKRKLFDESGKRIPVHLLDDKTAAAISHMGAHDLVPFDKLKALDMSAKYLGAYEKDNAQKAENLAIQIVLE
jgi:phage terminase small subunit